MKMIPMAHSQSTAQRAGAHLPFQSLQANSEHTSAHKL